MKITEEQFEIDHLRRQQKRLERRIDKLQTSSRQDAVVIGLLIIGAILTAII